MRKELQIFDNLLTTVEVQFAEMDLVAFVADSGIAIHPLFRKLYNPHVFSCSFELAGLSDVLSFQPLNQDNLEGTTAALGSTAVTLAVDASGILCVIKAEFPDQVILADTYESGVLPSCDRMTAEEFIDPFTPFGRSIG